MFRSLFARLFSTRPTQPIRRAPRRLGLEVLEGREVPAVITVNTVIDNFNPGSNLLTLREAVSLTTGALTFAQLSAAEKAQVSGTIGDHDRIQFSVGGTIGLTAALPTITQDVIIEGPGSDKLTISGAASFRHFTVGGTGDLTISGLHLINGHDAGPGGSLLNNGKLTLVQVEMNNNSSDNDGGAIANFGTLLVDECFVHDNQADGVGGAIVNFATAVVQDTTLLNNTAGNTGGAIWSDGTLILKNDTITGNKAKNFGGGLRLTDGSATVTSCTIVNNQADTDGTNETGGGISNGSATLTLNNTVVTGNTRNKGLVKDDINGNASGQFNFIGVNTGLTGISNGVSGNQVGTPGLPLNPLLMVLSYSGGFAPTFTPAPGSSLLAAGAPTSIAGLLDQRGAGRRTGGATIGAVEVNNPLSPVGVSRHLDGPGPITTANEAFIKALYRACLLRDADAGGLANWLNLLNSDPTKRDVVVNGFYNSTENRNAQVTFFYRYFLSREPDAPGLAHWVGQLQSGVDEANVMRGFLLSPEFTGMNDNAQFVNKLYYALLGRNADAAGFAFWKGQLDNNAMSRAQEVDAFARSTETVQRVVSSYHQVYLGVEPSAILLNVQSAAIQSGFTFGLVARSILGSDAFFNKVAANVGP